MSQSTRRILLAVLLASSVAAPLPAFAQERYPSRPITLVVPIPAAGQTDVVGRVIGEQLAKRLDQPVLVENRPGGNGSLASEQVARRPADGYTLVVTGPGADAINQLVNGHVKYDARKHFAHVAMLARTSNVLLASPACKANSLADVIAQSRAQPKSVNFALTGIDASGHLEDVAVAASLAQAAALWNLHENVTHAQQLDGANIKHDSAQWQGQTDAVNKIVHDAVGRRRGSISAEHGVGQLKRHELALYKLAVELRLCGPSSRPSTQWES
jgi:tripartite-type tricarboxylate transporter receptor subunit TctC